MPELPEVEFTRRCLERWVLDDALLSLTLGAHATDADRLLVEQTQASCGVKAKVKAIHRHGKYLFLDFGPWGFSLHLGMTGKWVPEANLETRHRHVRLQLVFTKMTLCFLDVRKFGYALRMSYGDWRKSLSERRVGLDVFDLALTPRRFHESVCRGRVSIKSALLNQQRVCGVGNIYACEALYDAKMDPRAPAGKLNPLQAERLLYALRAVMTDSLERETGDEIYYLTDGNPQNPFHVYGRGGDSCGRCGGMIGKMTQNARTTFFCQGCQATLGSM